MKRRIVVEDAKRVRTADRATLEPTLELTKGEILEVDGSVHVSNRPGYVWVKTQDQAGGITAMFNPTVAARNGMPVLIGAMPKVPWRPMIRDVNWELLADLSAYDGDPYLPAHSSSHEWPDFGPGSDVVQIYMRALVMLRVYPGTGLAVCIAPGRYTYTGESVRFPGQTDYDLSGSQPGANLARYTLIYLDKTTNTISNTDGATATDVFTITPPEPAYPSMANVLLALVRIDDEQASFAEIDIIDLRSFWDEGLSLRSINESIAILEAEYDFATTRHMIEGG